MVKINDNLTMNDLRQIVSDAVTSAQIRGFCDGLLSSFKMMSESIDLAQAKHPKDIAAFIATLKDILNEWTMDISKERENLNKEDKT